MKRLLGTLTLTVILGAAGILAAQDDTVTDRVKSATEHLNQKQKFKLMYRFEAEDQLRWDVEHTASTKAQIAGTLEETSSRSQSKKLWKVVNVDATGNMRFVHSIESVKMWQKIGDEEPVTFNSLTDKTTPAEFAGITEKIGKPLAMITISPEGKIIDRKSASQQAKFGVGDICIPLPKEEIAVGHEWYVATTFKGNDEDGRPQNLKARINYKLNKVKGKYAYVSFKTQVLTPIESEKVRSQILQQLTNGYAVFNMETGKMTRKEVEWNEKVQGYEGPDSFLQYNGRMTEKFVTTNNTPVTADATTSQNVEIKDRNDKPVLRK
ncbi:MAG: hypothetical protein MK106_10720 [Mariniblastus sp.]|nr:hypothetical protein [Mariniblastus sp.]